MEKDGGTVEEQKPWLGRKGNNGQTNHEDIHFKQQGFWASRSSLEKCLIVLVTLITIALIGVLIGLIVVKQDDSSGNAAASLPTSSEKTERQVCTTRDCVKAAARIANNMDFSVNPCEDLYTFACGKWMDENVIPEDRSSYNMFATLRDKTDVILKNLLEKPIAPDEIDSVKKSKVLYKSCMNTSAIDDLSDTPLKQFIVDTFNGWPLTTKDWDETTFNFEDTLLQATAHGAYAIIAVYIQADLKNSTTKVLSMDQPSFGMPGQKYYLVPRDDKNLKAYEQYMYNIGELMGFADPATAEDDVKDIVDFEIQLANISVPDEERRDSNDLYNPMTLKEVSENYTFPYFNWTKYVEEMVHYDGVSVNEVTDQEIIINGSPEYFQRLQTLLENTSNKTIANYLVWRVVRTLVSALGEKYKEPRLVYDKVLWGTLSEKARFRTCVTYVTGQLGLAVGNLFIAENFHKEAKEMADQMIDGLQSSFNHLLDELDWMDDETKKVAREKNDFITPKIGYPEEVTNATYLNEYYSNYTYDEDLYFKNVIKNRKEGYKTYIRKFRDIIDKQKWESPPSTVNAFYSSQKNQIMFPAGILQPPFFSQTYPKSLNYGGIGVVIGHEITHGFDDRGRQYDKDGNLVQWWSQSAIDKFTAKARCIINQYGNFTVDEIGMNLNGVNTQGENIADNGGLKQSFDAYRAWVKAQGHEEPSLPGLDFSHNQLFFINFAQLWCNKMREGAALNSVRTGVHSPGRFRVIGSVQNSEDFAEAFKCPSNTKMNPTKKCRVW